VGGGPSRKGSPVHLTISCDTCVARHTSACEDCVVTFLCGAERSIQLDDAEAEAVAGLAAAGLVPDLRYRPGCGSSGTHPSSGRLLPGRDGAELSAEPCTDPRRPANLGLVTGGRPRRHH